MSKKKKDILQVKHILNYTCFPWAWLLITSDKKKKYALQNYLHQNILLICLYTV